MFEMEIVDGPDLSKLNWVYDDDRGRVLVRTDRLLDQVPSITVRATAMGSAIDFDNPSIKLDDGRGRAETAYYEYDETSDQINRWFYDNDIWAADEPVSETFEYRFDREEILGQYRDGEWSENGISPGDITVDFGYRDSLRTTTTAVLDVPEMQRSAITSV